MKNISVLWSIIVYLFIGCYNSKLNIKHNLNKILFTTIIYIRKSFLIIIIITVMMGIYKHIYKIFHYEEYMSNTKMYLTFPEEELFPGGIVYFTLEGNRTCNPPNCGAYYEAAIINKDNNTTTKMYFLSDRDRYKNNIKAYKHNIVQNNTIDEKGYFKASRPFYLEEHFKPGRYCLVLDVYYTFNVFQRFLNIVHQNRLIDDNTVCFYIKELDPKKHKQYIIH